MRGLCTDGNLCFKIDWVSLIAPAGRKFTVFALFYFVKLRAISKYKPPEDLYLEGQLNGVFSALRVWGAYIWSGSYMEGLIFGILRYLTLSQSG